MARIRRSFGPFFYVTVVAALAILVSVSFWPSVLGHWQAWTLSRHLHDATAGARGQAAEGLAMLGPTAPPWLIRAMKDPDAKVRLLACSTLPRTDPDHPAPIFDALTAALGDGDASVRRKAANQLGAAAGVLAPRAGAEATGHAVEALRVAIWDRDKDFRGAAVSALGAFGLSAKGAVADLDRALFETEPTFRVHAADAMLRIDPVGTRPRVIPALRGLLANPSALYEEDRAVRLLKKEIGEEGVATVLIGLLDHKDPGVRQGALLYLDSSCPGAKGTKPAFVAALNNADWMIRCDAALLVLKHEPTMSGPALDTLMDQLVNFHDGGYFPEDIISKLRETAPDLVARVVPRMIEALGRAESPDGRYNAIHTLSVIGPSEAKAAIPALHQAALTGDQFIGPRAAEALAKIDPPSAVTLIPSLLDWIRPAEDVAVRMTAMATLGEIGPEAKVAVPALLEAADEEEIRISSAAIAALSKIDPPRAAALKRSIRDGN